MAETGVNELAELSGGFSVLIRPVGAPRMISGNSTSSVIRINGADNVTIDGSLGPSDETESVGGNAAIRNLTVQNISTSATGGAVIAVSDGNNGAQNVTIKNVNVLGQDSTQTLIGIHIGGYAVGTPPTMANNNNVRVENCSIQKTFVGIFDDGLTSSIPATGNVITRNDLSATGASRLGRAGVFFFNQNGIQVTENSIGGITSDEIQDAIGIIAGIQDISATETTSGGISNANISGNKINGVAVTSTIGFSAAGIALASNPSATNTIANNMISGVTSPSTSPDLVAGIYIAGVSGSNTQVYFNSISLTGDRLPTGSEVGSYGIAITGSPAPLVDLRDNIIYTSQTSSGGGPNAKSYVLGTVATTAGLAHLTSNFHLFFLSGPNAAGFRTGSLGMVGTDLATLSDWRSATGKDVNSISADPLFFSPVNDLHISCGSPATNNGTAISGITVDFDGQLRNPTPDIGADEQVAPTLINAVSRTVHAGAGAFDITLPGVECRSGGAAGNYEIVFTFSVPVTFTGA